MRRYFIVGSRIDDSRSFCTACGSTEPTPKPGIREQNLSIADIGRLKAERPVSFHGLRMCMRGFAARRAKNGRHSEKEPHGRCRGEGCAQEQQQIGAPGRLGLCGLGGTIELIDLVWVD